METRILGRTGLQVSLLTFGCGAVGGLMPKGEPADQRRAVELALELGVNFFDTAPLYGNGRSETNLGRILADLRPDIVLGTKVRIAPDQKKNVSRAVTASIEDSLQRLQQDHVDILQLHNPIAENPGDGDLSPEQVLQDVVPALERIKRDGKTRFIGMTAIGETAALHKLVDAKAFDTGQIVYNMLNPSAGGPIGRGFPGQDYAGLLAKAKAAGMGSIVIRSVAGGALSGREERHPLGMPVVAPIGSGADYAADVARACELVPAMYNSDCASLVEMAIRYVGSHPDVSTLQVGIATAGQFQKAAEAINKGALPENILAQICNAQSGFAA
ncbi:MAG: aldo/keto reductase [Alphaproteobacteria bacterium]|nr:aldo/keto reductase [Alphaproteobacteria bacterium]